MERNRSKSSDGSLPNAQTARAGPGQTKAIAQNSIHVSLMAGRNPGLEQSKPSCCLCRMILAGMEAEYRIWMSSRAI